MNNAIKSALIILLSQVSLSCVYEEPLIEDSFTAEAIDGSGEDVAETGVDGNETTDPEENPVTPVDPLSTCGAFSEMVLDFESPLDASKYNAYRADVSNGKFTMEYPSTSTRADFSPISQGIETTTSFELGEGRLSLEMSSLAEGSNIEMFLKVRATADNQGGDALAQIGLSESQVFVQLLKDNNVNHFKAFGNDSGAFYALNVSADTITLENSDNGLDWTEMGSIPAGITGVVTVELQSYQGAYSEDSHVVTFDNVNVDCD